MRDLLSDWEDEVGVYVVFFDEDGQRILDLVDSDLRRPGGVAMSFSACRVDCLFSSGLGGVLGSVFSFSFRFSGSGVFSLDLVYLCSLLWFFPIVFRRAFRMRDGLRVGALDQTVLGAQL